MSHIAKRFERDLPLATLFQHPTVATLAVVLRQELAFEEPTPLTAIHKQGSRPPFFCVHPAGGTAFCYVNLARRLGPDQPFYGLHAPDISGREGEWGTVEAIATHYLAALQTVQPQGPYLLGGWSAGGILAFEIAQQLQQQGQVVDLLALLDTSPPSVQLREDTLEEEVDLGDVGVAKELIHHFRLTTPEDFDQREPEEQLVYALAQAKKMHGIPADTSIELARRYIRTSMLMKHIVHLYVAKSYPYRIDYFASTQRGPIPTGDLEQTEPLDEGEELADRRVQCWRELATGGMEVHLVPGDHLTLIEEPYVQGLANELGACIDRVCERLGATSLRDSVSKLD
jgi:thioesterase domain-containing protein